MVNVRSYWPIMQVAIKPNSVAATGAVAPFNSRWFATGALASGVNEVSSRWEVPRGLQSIGMTTNFNTEEVFQLGQVEVYEQSERQPDIEVTLSKAIDGSKPLFFMLTDATQGNDIVARTANFKADVALQLYPDTQFRATGRPVSICTGSGMVLSSHSLTFPVDGFVTEDVTLQGNDKIWGSMQNVSGVTVGGGGPDPLVVWPDDSLGNNPDAPEGLPSGQFGHDGLTSALLEGGAFESAGPPDKFGIIVVGSGIQRREEVEIARSILPLDIPGAITIPQFSGINAAYVNGGAGAQGPGTASASTQLIANANTDNLVEHIQSITVSCDLSREDIFELGSKRPFFKSPAFPIEVTCAIEVITAQGDFVDATSDLDCCDPGNTSPNNTIIIRTCDGLQVDLGDSNRLTSVDMAGGEAGGSNVTMTYNYQSFNVYNLSHDFFQPNHRILVFATGGNTRFNKGCPPFTRARLGIF